ncbi:MAG TPA: hypothetical protein DCF68_07825 [Cyanothece sp. UBA12306]|nr:hypothetical protein [Cyanothece sp. UBA12306]
MSFDGEESEENPKIEEFRDKSVVLSSKQKKLKILNQNIDLFYSEIAEKLYDNDLLQADLFFRLEGAKRIISVYSDTGESDIDESDLDKADFDIRRVGAVLSREIQQQKWEARLRFIVPILVFVYTAIIVGIIFIGSNTWDTETIIPIIDIPVFVLVWSGIGSLATILFRFYKKQQKSASDEIRWLIARPIIGIITGAVVYLAIISGLTFLGLTNIDEAVNQKISSEAIAIIAFLGSFSDLVFDTVINNIIGGFSQQNNSSSS